MVAVATPVATPAGRQDGPARKPHQKRTCGPWHDDIDGARLGGGDVGAALQRRARQVQLQGQMHAEQEGSRLKGSAAAGQLVANVVPGNKQAQQRGNGMQL